MSAKQVVFRYNGNPTSDELELDLDDEMVVPERNDLITLKSEQWKVIHVTKEETITVPTAIPIVRIYLTNQF